jgi:hypothetical protein
VRQTVGTIGQNGNIQKPVFTGFLIPSTSKPRDKTNRASWCDSGSFLLKND